MDIEAVGGGDFGVSMMDPGAGLADHLRDREGDEKVLDLLRSGDEGMVTYSYDFRPWEIRVASAGEEGVALIFKESPPPELRMHLEGLAGGVRVFVGPAEPAGAAAEISMDEEIGDFFQGNEFASRVFSYDFEGERWDVRLIHNPDLLPLWAEGASEVVHFPYAIIVAGAPPTEMVSHLKGLAAGRWKRRTGYVSLAGLFQDPFYRSAGMGPIMINRDGNLNGTFDPLIRDCFGSRQFINRVFHYQWGNKYFHVRLVNNPGKQNIRVTRWFADPYDPKPYTMDWSYRFGIMVDEEAPAELIQHFVDLARPASSWWDWYRGFYISNGPREVVLKGGVKGLVGDLSLFEYARP